MICNSFALAIGEQGNKEGRREDAIFYSYFFPPFWPQASNRLACNLDNQIGLMS
jgi:hypothetical protein